jgi:hypothetical protein
LSCFSGGALKSHIPSSAAADVTQAIAHTTASDLSFRECREGVNIGKHKMLTSARQPPVLSSGDDAPSGIRAQSIKQHAWDFGRTVSFANS